MLSSNPSRSSIGDNGSEPNRANSVSASTVARRPKTIGLLADYMNASGSAYEAHIRDGIDAQCRERGYNLLVVYGRALEDPAAASAPHNAIFELVGPENVDGLVLVSSCLAAHTGADGVARLAQRYPSLPLCSLGIEVPAIPSIVADNVQGMEAVIDHLISVHGRRRIAFVAGIHDNPEAQIRLAVYCQELRRHGIAYDPALVGNGAFAKEHAHRAVAAMIEQGLAFDAVVAANDAMAAGAIQALHHAGQRVPRDVLVTGYDDMPFARLGNPSLTTVRQPFEAMTTLAVDTLIKQMAGDAVPMCTNLRTEMVIRRSCGCSSYGRNPSGPPARTASGDLADHVALRASHLQQVVAQCLKTGQRDTTGDAKRLVEGLLQEIQGEPAAFLRVVEDLIESAADDDDRGRALLVALGALRKECLGAATLEFEALCYEACALVALANSTGRALDRLNADERAFLLMGTAEQTSLALDLPALEQVLARVLPNSGIRTAFLAYYTDEHCDELEPLVCVVQSANITPEVGRYRAGKLLPTQAYGSEQRLTFLIFPMAYDGQALGLAAFAYEDRAARYNMVLAQISGAVRKIALHQEILQKTKLHERSVQERLATTKRLEALSVLAGAVAHDLNNVLSPMLALSDVVIAELAELSLPSGRLLDLTTDMHTIRAASLQAAQTIGDLLTLGRQGRLAKDALSLNDVVQRCGDASLRALRDLHPELDVTVDLTADSVMVLGSEAQLARAVANLIHNAADAAVGRGCVRVATSRVNVAEPYFGFERIEPGEYAVVTVTDDGAGIADAELSRIFEPYFSTKRAAERSGTGLGLAIVHGVVKEHQGFIDVTSTVGNGTTFALYIPLTRRSRRISVPLPPVRTCNAKILVVDDDVLLLRTCSRVLGRLGYQVIASRSAQQSYEEFARAAASGTRPCDLVVADMILNEPIDGLEFIARIRELFPAQKAIIASGHADIERVHRAAERGLLWLAKPYTAATLARAVQAALEA